MPHHGPVSHSGACAGQKSQIPLGLPRPVKCVHPSQPCPFCRDQKEAAVAVPSADPGAGILVAASPVFVSLHTRTELGEGIENSWHKTTS